MPFVIAQHDHVRLLQVYPRTPALSSRAHTFNEEKESDRGEEGEERISSHVKRVFKNRKVQILVAAKRSDFNQDRVDLNIPYRTWPNDASVLTNCKQ